MIWRTPHRGDCRWWCTTQLMPYGYFSKLIVVGVYHKATCTMFGEEQRGVQCHLGGKTPSKNHVTLRKDKNSAQKIFKAATCVHYSDRAEKKKSETRHNKLPGGEITEKGPIFLSLSSSLF